MSHESILYQMMAQEGIKENKPQPAIFRSNEVINTALVLFHSYLANEDPRWELATAWAQLEQAAEVQRIHKEVALGAIYLSEMPSFRNGYSQFAREPNIRQLCRAIYNLSVWPRLSALGEHMPEVTHPNWHVTIKRTNRIVRGVDGNHVTGCPEALYQLQLWQQDVQPRYIGRVGFNIHNEDNHVVGSITNLQGIPDGKDNYEIFSSIHGYSPFSILMQQAKGLLGRFDQAIEIRGLRNPPIENPELLNTVLESEDIPRYYFRRN